MYVVFKSEDLNQSINMYFIADSSSNTSSPAQSSMASSSLASASALSPIPALDPISTPIPLPASTTPEPGTLAALGPMPTFSDWQKQIDISLAKNSMVRVLLSNRIIGFPGQRPINSEGLKNMVKILCNDNEAEIHRGRIYPIVIVGETADTDKELRAFAAQGEPGHTTWGLPMEQRGNLILVDGQHRFHAARELKITDWYAQIINKGMICMQS